MVSSSSKSPVHTREHRERGQPLERQKLGILEKKKDYVVRAKNYHTKRLRIERLQEKAKDRNKDEFYYGMKNQKTNRGVHVTYKESQTLTTEIAKVLKAQDANYIRTMKRANLKRIASLKSQLMILADLVQPNSKAEDDVDMMDDVEGDDGDSNGPEEGQSGSEEDESDDSEKTAKKEEKKALRTKVNLDAPLSEKDLEALRDAGILPRSQAQSHGREGASNGHIVFVDDEKSAWNYHPPKAGSSSRLQQNESKEEEDVDLGWITPANSKKKGKQRASEPEDELDPYAKARGRKQRTKLLKELAARLERNKHLRFAEQELEMQRLTMAGKGAHRKMKEKEQLFKDPDEAEDEEFTFRRRNRMPVVELGNEVYKPKVFKWRQERKR